MHFDGSTEEQDFIAEINKLQSSNIEENSEDTDLHSRTILDYEESVQHNKKTPECCEDSSEICCKLHLLADFKVPPLLCRHPIPATDDDIRNLKDILQEMTKKLGRSQHQNDRILFAPDHKIAKNLLKLTEENPYFRQFLPEFPALHLRKSKIVNLFSDYKNAGLVHLLKFMKDSEQEDDWMTLIIITLQNIEIASRNITRLSVALHRAVLLTF
ncbi:hypothetical protein DPMN_107870 [Dreissena polymorpha]|uniref:Uncharacterized protein n=1 Tax=Dreissena polymorpha TaxID=45954 RepID=A0A9D4QKD3_DREPO|nr:hypothetical protein DPMN_107870 [Dreissena polymorpha]